MSLPQKKSRPIEVDGHKLRWLVVEKPESNDMLQMQLNKIENLKVVIEQLETTPDRDEILPAAYK